MEPTPGFSVSVRDGVHDQSQTLVIVDLVVMLGDELSVVCEATLLPRSCDTEVVRACRGMERCSGSSQRSPPRSLTL